MSRRFAFSLPFLVAVACACTAVAVPTREPPRTVAPSSSGAPGARSLAPGETPPPPDAGVCAVATPAEVSAIYGVTFVAARPSASDTHEFCDYATVDGRVVAIAVTSSGGDALFEVAAAQPGAAMADVGDRAYATDAGLLFVLSGEMLVVVRDTVEGNAEQAAALARLVLERL
jgi:hypothetical protein